MKLTVQRTVCEDVILSPDNVNKVVKKKLSTLIDGAEYIRERDGKDWLYSDLDTHGSPIPWPIREADDLDKAVLKVLSVL